MTKIKALASTCLVLGLLTACGGGSSDYTGYLPTVTGTDVPVAATTGAAGVVSFAQDQLARTSESSDPLVLGTAVLAVDDTAEPAPV